MAEVVAAALVADHYIYWNQQQIRAAVCNRRPNCRQRAAPSAVPNNTINMAAVYHHTISSLPPPAGAVLWRHQRLREKVSRSSSMWCHRTHFYIDLLINCEDHSASQKDNAAVASTAEAAEGCPIGV